MAYTMDTTLGDLLADPQATQIMNQYVPGLATNPMVAMVKGVSLKMLVSMPQAAQMGFTPEKAQQIIDEINKNVK